jgi:hypothetical protein
MSIEEFQSAPFAMLAETEGDDEEEDARKFRISFIVRFVKIHMASASRTGLRRCR